jgi:hypothetical protein
MIKPSGTHALSALLSFTLALLIAVSAMAAEPQVKDPERAQVLEKVKSMLILHDSFKAIEYMASLGGPVLVATRYLDLIDDLYWKEKAIESVMIMGRAGIQEILTSAAKQEKSDRAMAERLQTMAKRLSYNLASYTWPGWDEPGIVIKPDYLLVGSDAARVNLRLTLALNNAALKVSIAYWMLGAQQLAIKDFGNAIKTFGISLDKAKEARQRAYQYLSLGFIGIAEIAAGTEADAGRRKYSEAITVLAAMKTKDADMFVGQIKTAAHVFLGGEPMQSEAP